MFIVVKYQSRDQKNISWTDVPTRVHATREDARVEAERLAKKHPDNYFGVFILENSAICSVNPVQWTSL